MRIKHQDQGYAIWLSANDTYNWAHRPGNRWPCSTLAGKRLFALVDSNGLCDLTIDGRTAPDDIDGNELDAIVADFTRATPAAQHWPCWDFGGTPAKPLASA